MFIYNLPPHLLLIIRDFVFLPDSYENHKQCNGEENLYNFWLSTNSLRPEFRISSPVSWRNFVNANKKDFAQIKQLTVYYDLRNVVSTKLLGITPKEASFSPSLFGSGMDNQFLTTSLQRIKNLPVCSITTQVNLGLSMKITELPAVFLPKKGNMHIGALAAAERRGEKLAIPFPFERLTVKLEEMGDNSKRVSRLQASENVYEISLESFPFVKYLSIWNNKRYNENIQDILKIHINSSMQLHSFRTNIRCEFEGHAPKLFQNLTTASIPLLPALPDRIVFGSMLKVDLSWNKGLNDVSSLRDVHTLNIRNCEQVEDVSLLGDVFSLNISNCYRILSISQLGRVKKLSINGLTALRDGLPADNEVKELWVDTTTYITAGVSEFKDQNKRINLCTPQELSPSLKYHSYLRLPFSRLSVDFFDLQANCDLTAIRELVLEKCLLPAEFPPMMSSELRRLLLLECKGMQKINFDSLPKLKILKKYMIFLISKIVKCFFEINSK